MLFTSAVSQVPPTRTSNSCWPMLAPSGPHHFSMMSGLVHASNSFSGLVAMRRDMVRTRSSVAVATAVLPFFHQPLQAVERAVPEAPVALEPVLDLAEPVGARAEDP